MNPPQIFSQKGSLWELGSPHEDTNVFSGAARQRPPLPERLRSIGGDSSSAGGPPALGQSLRFKGPGAAYRDETISSDQLPNFGGGSTAGGAHQKYNTLQEPMNVRSGARDLPPRADFRHSHREPADRQAAPTSHRRADAMMRPREYSDHGPRRDRNSSEGGGVGPALLANSSMPNQQSLDNLASSLRAPISVYEGGRDDSARPPLFGSMHERANRTLDADAARQHQRMNSSQEGVGRFRQPAADVRQNISNFNESSNYHPLRSSSMDKNSSAAERSRSP